MDERKTKHRESSRLAGKLRRQVADCLVAAMTRKRITSDDLILRAKIPNLTKSSMSLYRHGKVLPSRDRLEVLLRVCGETVPEDIHVAYHAASNSHMSQSRGNESAKEFVIAWQGSNSVAEVAIKLGISSIAANGRAHNYRKKGVNLKKFERLGLIDSEELNGLINEMDKSQEQED